MGYINATGCLSLLILSVHTVLCRVQNIGDDGEDQPDWQPHQNDVRRKQPEDFGVTFHFGDAWDIRDTDAQVHTNWHDLSNLKKAEVGSNLPRQTTLVSLNEPIALHAHMELIFEDLPGE